MLSQDIVDSLFPPDLPEPDHWEHRYPPRDLPEGAKVTRIAPSPTGFLTIGGVFTAMIDSDVAHHSGGVYLVRLEDTDQARFTEGAAEQFAEAFEYFSINPDEDDRTGRYGPYTQSARAQTYLTYVRELLRQGRAYVDFTTRQDLEEISARQREAGALPGYYGKWATWRDADPDEVAKRLAAGEPYVVRFRSPGVSGNRVSFTDAIRGELSMDDNRNNAVILKSSDTEPRLPTYHFAHAVDDHLMRVNLVIRGEEWISSVPLHLQLFDALGFERVQYAHVATLMKQDGSSRRKLSKRRDPEATVTFYIEQGYPAPAVQYYLRGLANGRLAEMPLAEALAAPIRLSECGTAGPLVDTVKLDDISGDYIATLSGEQILAEVSTWAARYDPELADVLAVEPDLALRALAIEREGVPNPRKDLRKWADFRAVYGYFFPQIFELVTDPADARFGEPGPGRGAGRGPGLRRGLPAAHGRTPSGSTRSASWRPSSGSRRATRSTSRTRMPTPAPSPMRPRSSGCCSPARSQPRPGRGGPRARHRGGPAPRPRGQRRLVAVPGTLLRLPGRPGADRLLLVQAVQVQLLGVLQHHVLLLLRLFRRLLGQLGGQAAELADAGVVDDLAAAGEDDDALHPPVLLLGRRQGGAHLRSLGRVGGARGELVALLQDPLVELHHRAVQGQVPDVVVGQGEPLALAEAAAVGEHGGRPQRQRHQRVPFLLGLGQVGEQPLAAVHDELEL